MPTDNVQNGGLSESRMARLRDEVRRRDDLSSLARLMNSAGNATRMRILYLLWRNCEVRVNDIAEILELTTPAISQQLKKLRAQRIVSTRRDAQTIYYSLNNEVELVRYITGIFSDEHAGDGSYATAKKPAIRQVN